MTPPPAPSGAHDASSGTTVEPGGTPFEASSPTCSRLEDATRDPGSVASPRSAAATSWAWFAGAVDVAGDGGAALACPA
ncbi:hypothetical protein [Amycolatopsis kentuckyensis]|uniref:hypothetical protein n=1 Tax=Amycolatopsis kentuckyensis TaxID=218823 RepID=UPI0035695FEC